MENLCRSSKDRTEAIVKIAELEKMRCRARWILLLVVLFTNCSPSREPVEIKKEKKEGAVSESTVALGQKRTLPRFIENTRGGLNAYSLRIVKEEKTADGSLSVEGRAIHMDEAVGLRMIIRPDWEEVKGEEERYAGYVVFRSTGSESDRFVGAIDALYGADFHANTMGEEVPFAALCSVGDPRKEDWKKLTLKLIFAGTGEDTYTQLSAEIDRSTRMIRIREKHVSYRNATLKALSGKR